MQQLEVVESKFPMYMVGVLGLVLGPLIIGMMIMSLKGGIKPVPLILSLLLLATFFGVVWIYFRGRGRSIRSFSIDGLVRNDGQEFAWEHLNRVVDKMAIKPGSEKKRLWRKEIQFDDGTSAWLIPSKISNFDEVNAYVARLQCEHVQENA